MRIHVIFWAGPWIPHSHSPSQSYPAFSGNLKILYSFRGEEKYWRLQDFVQSYNSKLGNMYELTENGEDEENHVVLNFEWAMEGLRAREFLQQTPTFQVSFSRENRKEEILFSRKLGPYSISSSGGVEGKCMKHLCCISTRSQLPNYKTPDYRLQTFLTFAPLWTEFISIMRRRQP